MSDTDDTAAQAERARLMAMARAGKLTPTTWQRLDELNEQLAGPRGER